MFFVWSWWYLVIALLISGIVAMAVVLVKMNKKDIQIIEDFQKENAVEEAPTENSTAAETKPETNNEK